MRPTAFVAILAWLAAGPTLAEGNDSHLAEADGLRVVHGWTRASNDGEAFVFAEIENSGAVERVLTGAKAEGATMGDVVGFGYANGRPLWTVLPGVPVMPGSDLHLEPNMLALRLGGLSGPLEAGDHLDVRFVFDNLEIAAEVEILDAGASEHSHAGHSH